MATVSPVAAFDPAGAPELGLMDAEPASASLDAYEATSTEEFNPGGIFDEVRLGGSTHLRSTVPEEEDGLFIQGEVLFDPLWSRFDNPVIDAFLRPRPHFGGTLSTDDGTNQIYGGFTWNFPLGQVLFLEASFGGTLHDGELHRPAGTTELNLGCRVLFRESAGIGLNLGPNWRVLGFVDHSSHASLCDDYNAGISHAGASVGYRF
jgi:hypothetical protein